MLVLLIAISLFKLICSVKKIFPRNILFNYCWINNQITISMASPSSLIIYSISFLFLMFDLDSQASLILGFLIQKARTLFFNFFWFRKLHFISLTMKYFFKNYIFYLQNHNFKRTLNNIFSILHRGTYTLCLIWMMK